MGMKFSLRPARSGAGYLLPATLCVITAAACASSTGASGTGATSTSAASKPSAPQAKISLTVVVSPGPGITPKRWTLRCDPTGGTHPDAKAACRELLAAKNPFAPIPRGIMCPMIVAGPQKATISGIYFGERVATTFTRSGCQAARWAELGDVFGFRSGSGGESGSPVH